MGKAKKLAAPRPNPLTFEPGVDEVTAEPLVLIVVPTRELAVQIFNEARKFCYRSMLRPCVVYGGVPVRQQTSLLNRGCDVIIGTPGRLVDFIHRPQLLSLRRLKYLVIDEADEMLDQDWGEELQQILTGGGKYQVQSSSEFTIGLHCMQSRMRAISSMAFSPPPSPRMLATLPRSTSAHLMFASVLVVPEARLPTSSRSSSKLSDMKSVTSSSVSSRRCME